MKRIRELADMKIDWMETDDTKLVKEILDSAVTNSPASNNE